MAPQARPPQSRTRSAAAKSSGGGGGRKGGVLHPVDTNPAAYDRTDPFTALNVLRKLLSALPSRLGGCQYKLTPEEHKLTLHLLTVVEPFVGLAPCASRRALARQPTEILDAIAFHIDGKRDLLSLALSCKRLYSIVFPRHFEYRVIKCKASALSVWNHLVVHRSLARNVRRVEILDERAGEAEQAVPSDIMTTDTDMESTDDELALHDKQERFVVSALGRMTALQSFKWSCNHSLVAFERVWPALVKCQTVSEVEVNDNLIFHALPVDESHASTAHKSKRRPAVLLDLKKVGLHGTKSTFGASKNPDLSRISTMLHNCPNLEALDISYVARHSPGFFNPVADDFLLCGRWSSLRALTLTNLWCTPHAGLDAAASFLAAHVSLEVLHLEVSFGTGANNHGNGVLASFKFPPNCLPRLRELKASRDLATALLACPCDADGGRPLETLKGVRLSNSARDRVFLENLRAFGTQVRRLELGGWTEMEDVRQLAECVPRLVWLDIGKRGGSATNPVIAAISHSGSGSHAKATPNHVVSNFGEWASILAQMPELTAFHGIRFFYEVASTDSASLALSMSDRSRARKNDEVASVLAWKCPKLRRLDHWDDGAGRVVVLVRDAERVRYEVRRVKV
ncbi:hypothetical protein K466DRAFT_602354 [Polyporus arcularius HHB13444]|uniref:F-box domain-containing protein n=1 Tax=Polyporus arcularius HHB13444 TaxID=1314778 RepID=A0A5C3P729_9APHY|nr:hypothetical protein K466DRAFT_602354 [Polyporus arcularius HHB13444]